MVIQTKYFGEIAVEQSKIIEFEHGLMGFEEYKNYTILYDIDGNQTVSWLQSTEEPGLALPIMNPLIVKEDYQLLVNDEEIRTLGNINEENMALFVTMTVPQDITKMTVNLKAPILINSDNCKGCQVIMDNPDYEVKYSIYKMIEQQNDSKGVE